MIEAKHFPEWEKMTVREVRGYLERCRSVILPFGVTEQHGYHLPLCTDALIARELAKRVGKKLDMIVAPTLNQSFSGGQLPGTINLSPNVMGLMVGDVLRSLVAQGFRSIFILLCHGGSENARALDNTLKMLLREGPAFANVMLVLAPIWKFSSGWQAAIADHDWHAGWLETSFVMALAPELVQMEHLQLDAPELVATMREHPDHYQEARKPVDNEFAVPRMTQRAEIAVGVMGAPEKASRSRGDKLVDDAVDRLSRLFAELEQNRSEEYKKVAWTPEPIVL